jgi:hypothetical protein
VIKCNPHKTDLAPMVQAGRAHEHWCVADNYRTRLMAPGHPVLFWVSSHPRRGIWGAGRLTGTPVPGPQWKISTNIALFDEPILASDIRSVASLSKSRGVSIAAAIESVLVRRVRVGVDPTDAASRMM